MSNESHEIARKKKLSTEVAENTSMEPARGQFLIYQAEDGKLKLDVRLEEETVWLTQKLMAELFQKDIRTINEHIQNVYEEKELLPEATIRKFRIVRREGPREVAREIEHYNLEAILAVGYRVRSPRGTQFRRWATERLSEYLVKGFTMDDQRLKNPPVDGSSRSKWPRGRSKAGTTRRTSSCSTPATKGGRFSARVELDVQRGAHVSRETVTVEPGDNLQQVTRRAVYADCLVQNIGCKTGEEYLELVARNFDDFTKHW